MGLGRMILSKRGLRQGDPLSFVFGADAFTKMLSLASSKGLLEGLGPEGLSQKVLSLQYALVYNMQMILSYFVELRNLVQEL